MSATDLAALIVISLTYLLSKMLLLGYMNRSVKRIERSIGRIEGYYDEYLQQTQPQHAQHKPTEMEGSPYGNVGGT